MRKRDTSWIVRRKGDGFIIPSDRIRIGPWGNARTDITPEMVEVRALSLIKEGQREPVKGLFSADNEWFELIDGELRLRGWKHAKTVHSEDLDLIHGGIYCELQSALKDQHLQSVIYFYFRYHTAPVNTTFRLRQSCCRI